MADIEQLRAFVVSQQVGSFSAAARELGKAQSAISAAIANLEIDLDLTLFDRSGYRPELTRQGRVVLGYAQSVLDSMAALEGQADALGAQVEPRFAIWIEEGLLVSRVRDLLCALADQFPGLELHIEERPRSEVISAVNNGQADLVLVSRLEETRGNAASGGMSRGIGFLRLVPVVHCDHPLAHAPEINRAELVKHRQLVSADGDRISPKIWVSDGARSCLTFVNEGLGWSELPAELVTDGVLSGSLKVLHYDFAQNSILETVGLLSGHSTTTGPVMRWILAELATWDQRAWIGVSRVGRLD
ncbi:LysR family transcriptional regulator [Halocynthiibacter styelae]|uniref:LysR family transcriptional regulator n=1 Tax=Halocynthiibacter styelae TaxID=2761955 RepID=A0A8J7IHR2_9RHOB|nr:LysR family transcriptional regulator [Paenihalocynthiibacter styelae]MBI1492398.1 LysR family transcriptional regulator [Paenihalocynthiibacter styelae]